MAAIILVWRQGLTISCIGKTKRTQIQATCVLVFHLYLAAYRLRRSRRALRFLLPIFRRRRGLPISAPFHHSLKTQRREVTKIPAKNRIFALLRCFALSRHEQLQAPSLIGLRSFSTEAAATDTSFNAIASSFAKKKKPQMNKDEQRFRDEHLC